MTSPTFDVYYFIRFFTAIPEKQWCEEKFGRVFPLRHCALGLCGMRDFQYPTKEALGLANVLGGGTAYVAGINDGEHPRYKQTTPKQRILAALRDVACAQLGEDEE